MKNIIRICLFFLIPLIFSTDTFSQSIQGKIIDASSSEVLPGAVIKIEGTGIGTGSDLDGRYSLDDLTPGTYNLIISYIGYTTQSIKNVKVLSNDVTKLDIALKVDGLSTEEIVVESNATLSNENSLLVEQKNSSKIQDGISEQQINRAPDPSASDVLKRVMGVNIVDNKFVYVRGTSERYNLTTLNGVLLPSTEADKKSFSFDLFPSKLLENIIVSKSFSPELPGNFSGGLVQLNTKDFVDRFVFTFETSGSYLDGTTSKGGFYNYNAGQNKFLFLNTGKDDGRRSIPSDFPAQKFTNVNEYGKSLVNSWGQQSNKAPLNGGFQMSLGNNFNLFDNPLGALFAYTYKNGFDNEDIVRNEYNSDTSSLVSYKGRSSNYTVLNGGILNMNYKIGINNKLSFKNTYSISSEDRTEYYLGFTRMIADYDRQIYATRFIERELFSTMISGNHFVPSLSKMNLNWNGSYSESNRNEPDTKTTFYQRDMGTDDPFYAPLTVIPNNNLGQRFYSNMFDINRNFSLNADMNFIKINKSDNSKLKFGLLAMGTDRNFDARNFAPVNNGSFSIGFEPIENIFKPENMDSSLLYYVEITDKSDKYDAVENLYSGYLMFDVPADKLRITAGLRYEYDEQKLNGFVRQTGEAVKVNQRNNDYLPSLNVIYAINNFSNLRLSASQTVSRPELREIAPFAYVDFVTEGLLTGNPELEESLIQNYDLRYELFPDAGEIASVSLFYKHFNQPIEKIIVPTLATAIPSYSFANAKNGAVNYGVEFEVRKKLDFLSDHLKYFSLNANLSLVNSKVDLTDVATSVTETVRRLQGQSPYTINLGLFYDNFNLGLSANILYNKDGDKISEVGRTGFYDVYELGRDVMDFSISKSFLKKFEAKFQVKDLFAQDKVFTENFILNGDQRVTKEVRRYSSGTSLGMSLSYKF